jgi:hypothetical protein
MIATYRELATPKRALSGSFVSTCGIFLPIGAIAFEAATGVCANMIDPMPSWWHLILLLTVPACNTLCWLGLRRDAVEHSRAFAAMAGYSGAVALFYTILFAPLFPVAAIGLLVLLPGLAFTPLLAFFSAVKLMRAWSGFAGKRAIAFGAACGVAAIALPAMPEIGVRAGAGMLSSERSWIHEAGFRMLRFDAVREALLEDCHARSSVGALEFAAWLSGRSSLPEDDARQLYYRVSGKSFDREPAPYWRGRPWISLRDDRDPNQGRDRVGGPVKEVQLTASRIDGRLDGLSAVAYFEWTLVFHNSGAAQQEARMDLALPPGGVVSRATLWVHGAEREAAFAERGQARQAYQNVVMARRDPLLVTTSGRDRVLVQCFPIEPGGDMKMRVGITAPIMPEGLSDRGVVTLPALLDRNFDAAEPAAVWVESKAAIAPVVGVFKLGGFKQRVREDGMNVMQGAFRVDKRAAVRLSGLTWAPVWAPDQAGGTGHMIEQRFVERPTTPPERAVVVVDGSESMRGVRSEITAALRAIPTGIETRVIVAARTGVMKWSPAMPWEGGVDPVPALEQALSLGSDPRSTAVVWIAGEQPLKMKGSEKIRQALEREQGRVKLSILAGGGVNLIASDLDGLGHVQTIPRLGTVAEDLLRHFAGWRAGAWERVVERKSPSDGRVAGDVQRGSSHIVRLWAAEESAASVERNRPEAVALAVGHQIVTPLSGAVVLETAVQYEQNGLKPPSGAATTITPEPGTWALLGTGLLVFGWLARRSRALG